MLVGDLIERFDREAVLPIYLLCPEKAERAKNASFEPVLAERAAKRIIDAFIDESTRDLAFSSYHADETDPSEIVSVAETLPFLAERRVIFVRNAERYDNEAAMKSLLPYIENPCPTAILILLANRIDRRLKLFKACDKAGFAVGCPELREQEVRLWINQEAKARDKRIDPDAVHQIVQRAGTRLSDVENALNLVCGYAGEEPVIHEADVVAACADVAEEEVWALTDAIATSNMREAVRLLRDLMELGKSEFEILGTINWLLRTAYEVAAGNPNDPKLRGFVHKKCRPLADKFGAKKLGAAFRLMVETDFMLRSTGTHRSIAMELLVIKLAAPRSRHRTA